MKEGDGYQFHKYLVKIVNADGKTIMTSETSDMMDMLSFPHPHEVDEVPWETERFKSTSGEIFIMMSAWADCQDCYDHKVLINTALSNAFRCSPSGSNIHIDVQEDDDQFLSISIRDNGIGIKTEELQNIFERFYRTPGAKLHDTRGSGLGLSIVKSILYLHGGTIDVRSEHSQGTTVILRFPAE